MASLDPDNASIMVCGGGGVALEVTRKLKDMGAWVWMLQRSESRRYKSLKAHTEHEHPSEMGIFNWRAGFLKVLMHNLLEGFMLCIMY